MLSLGLSNLVDLWLNAAKGQQGFMTWAGLALSEGILQQFILNTLKKVFLNLIISVFFLRLLSEIKLLVELETWSALVCVSQEQQHKI